MVIRNLFNKKLIFIILFVILIGISLFFFVDARKASSELKRQKEAFSKIREKEANTYVKYTEIQAQLNKINEEYENLKKLYETISLDRDNLLIEVKKRIADSENIQNLEEKIKKIESQNLSLLNEKEKLIEKNNKYQAKIKELTTIKDQLIKEKEQLKEALDEEKKRVDLNILAQNNKELQKSNAELNSRLKQAYLQIEKLKKQETSVLLEARNEIKKLKENEVKLNQELQNLKQKEKELNLKLAEAVKKNKMFEQRLANTPAKFTELARQNKILIKNTANMHYNMGVFYLRQKEYSRAVVEFEKAIELTPDDAYSHFNLGYIYAEYLVNRKKAIEHFRKYLQYVKKDDKDIDWVKKYILTWQTYDAKEPME